MAGARPRTESTTVNPELPQKTGKFISFPEPEKSYDGSFLYECSTNLADFFLSTIYLVTILGFHFRDGRSVHSKKEKERKEREGERERQKKDRVHQHNYGITNGL